MKNKIGFIATMIILIGIITGGSIFIINNKNTQMKILTLKDEEKQVLFDNMINYYKDINDTFWQNKELEIKFDAQGISNDKTQQILSEIKATSGKDEIKFSILDNSKEFANAVIIENDNNVIISGTVNGEEREYTYKDTTITNLLQIDFDKLNISNIGFGKDIVNDYSHYTDNISRIPDENPSNLVDNPSFEDDISNNILNNINENTLNTIINFIKSDFMSATYYTNNKYVCAKISKKADDIKILKELLTLNGLDSTDFIVESLSKIKYSIEFFYDKETYKGIKISINTDEIADERIKIKVNDISLLILERE